MECPMCWELYASNKVARNLICGHTYCQECLEKIYENKKRIECPMCRHKHEPSIKPALLSKNFVAMELAQKHCEILKKLQFCQKHTKNPLQFFCEDDQMHLCAECIVEHSGHKFCKQEHSVSLLKDRLQQIQEKLKGQYNILESQTKTYDQAKEQLHADQQQLITQLDDHFERVIKSLELRRLLLKEQQQNIYIQELESIESDLVINQSLLQNMGLINQKLDQANVKLSISYIQLDELKVLKDNSMITLIDDLEEQADRDIAQQKQLKGSELKKLPKLIFDKKIFSEIDKLGCFKKDVVNPQICFFGDKHKILIYNIEKEEWQFKQMPTNSLEYNYYAASASLPNGDVLITGGGVSKNVMLIQPSKGFQSVPLKNMYFPRKEHACVYLDGFLYAIGGYDGASKQMLACCEKYSLSSDEWRMIEPLNKQKCAFAAAAAVNKYIYVFGGFDGRERLNSIERYSVKDNQWKTLELKFRQAFSNAAAISYSDNQILILGGGYIQSQFRSNQGFSLELQSFDVQESTIKALSKMTEGRDLRNKLIAFDGHLYACGGNTCSLEKYSMQNSSWSNLKYLISNPRSYDQFISDNLDSWCSALTFEMFPLSSSVVKNNQKQVHKYSNQVNQYQNYKFADEVSFENDSFQIEDDEDLESIYMSRARMQYL